jgi:hypothetical protein
MKGLKFLLRKPPCPSETSSERGEGVVIFQKMEKTLFTDEPSSTTKKNSLPIHAVHKISHMNPKTFYQISPQAHSSEFGDETLILNGNHNIYNGLVGIGPFIWKELKQPKSIEQLKQAIMDEFDVAPDQCQRDLNSFIHSLLDVELLIETEEKHLP